MPPMAASATCTTCSVDDRTWAIRYMVVDTSKLVGRAQGAGVAAVNGTEVSWPEATVTVGMTREAIRTAPGYDTAAQVDRQLERAIHERLGRPVYWSEQAIRELEARVGR